MRFPSTRGNTLSSEPVNVLPRVYVVYSRQHVHGWESTEPRRGVFAEFVMGITWIVVIYGRVGGGAIFQGPVATGSLKE
jgi:hypothetical protein